VFQQSSDSENCCARLATFIDGVATSRLCAKVATNDSLSFLGYPPATFEIGRPFGPMTADN
jgi:hypothetical protein